MDRRSAAVVNADPTVKALRRRLRLMRIEHAPGQGTVRRELKAAIQAVFDRGGAQ